ncbi:MAG TPA: hypothetical protein VLF91_04285 [Candidatus Saccharimonadales bacterium]|nr:hypothetical protein [Candidatus Saccharimonadales bacterium]
MGTESYDGRSTGEPEIMPERDARRWAFVGQYALLPGRLVEQVSEAIAFYDAQLA